jgi:16S rRNA U516 pseudouridylate synthase RsuA-like enzyme
MSNIAQRNVPAIDPADCPLVVLVTTAYHNKHFILCLTTGTIREYCPSAVAKTFAVGTSHTCKLLNSIQTTLDRGCAAAHDSGYTALSAYWNRISQCGDSLSSACLLVDPQVDHNYAAKPSPRSFAPATIYMITHNEGDTSGAAHRLEEVEVVSGLGAVGLAVGVGVGGLQFTVKRSATLDLSCRVLCLGIRDTLLYVIAENWRVLVLELGAVSIQRVHDIQLSPALAPLRYLDYRNTAVFIIHKPVGCVSAAVPDSHSPEAAARGTVYDWAGKAGFPTNLALVGRLDAETSGIMVFTNDARLNDRILRPSVDADGANEAAVATCVGDATNGASDCRVDGKYRSKEYLLSLLQGRNKYCLNEHGELDVERFEQEFGRPLEFSRFHSAKKVQEAQIKVLRSYQDPALNPHNRSDMGWVTDVRVTIREGKHQQIRRLARRAGYHVVSLCRTAMCGGLLRLDSVPQPGQCRWLGEVEKRRLYEAFRLS